MRILTVLITAVLSACGASHHVSIIPQLDTPGDQLFIESRCEEDTKSSVSHVDHCNDAVSREAYRREYESYQRDYKTHR